ncbi:MAG: HTTM domain-containing protein [Acidimicrobiales bacterium]
MSALTRRTFDRFDSRFMEAVPARRLATLRILVSAFATVFLIVRSSYLFDISGLPAARFDPVGVLGWLGEPLPLWLVKCTLAFAVACGCASIVGWRYRVTGPLLAVSFLLLTTYDNSWQHVAHTENLAVLHLAVLAFAPAADAISLDERRSSRPAAGAHARYGWPVRLMSMLTVVTYVVAGIAKQRNGGIHWITGDVLRNQIANDNLRKIVLGDTYSPLGARMVAHAWLFPPMALATMVIELGAPLALLRGKVRTVMVGAMWMFHVAILGVMAIVFIYPLTLVAYAPLLRPERLADAIESRVRARRLRPASSAV